MPNPSTKSRQELRSRFVRSAIPTEADFADLIGASLNQADDGLLKLSDGSLGLVRQGQKSEQPVPVLRFFTDQAAEGSVWQLQLGVGEKPSFGLAAADGKPALFVDGPTGNVGIGTDKLAGKLHIAHANQDPNGGALILGPISQSNLRMGYNQEYSWIQSHGSKPISINAIGNNVGIGTSAPFSKLQITGNASITSTEGSNFACRSGFMAPGSLTIGGIDRDYGGGTNWNNNTAGLLLETRDNTEIAIHDSGLRLASFMHYESANNQFTIGRDMGWGPISQVNIAGSLTTIRGQTDLLMGSNPIRFSSGWTGFPDNKPNGAEISNDTSTYKTLMIVGNKSNGGGRRVSIWDTLEVNGVFHINKDGNRFTIDTQYNNVVLSLARSYHGGAASRFLSWDGDSNWDLSSDERLKTDIRTETEILPRLMEIDVKSFLWKDNLDSRKREIGFIAQEVQKAFPDLVKVGQASEGGLMKLNYTNFGILAVGAIKELNKALTAEIKALRAEVEQLRHRVSE